MIAGLNNISVRIENAKQPLKKHLIAAIKDRQGKVSAGAPLVLRIEQAEMKTTLTNAFLNAQVQEFTHRLIVRFQLGPRQGDLDTQILVREGRQQLNNNYVLGVNTEAKLIKESLYQEVARLIAVRLTAENAKSAI